MVVVMSGSLTTKEMEAQEPTESECESAGGPPPPFGRGAHFQRQYVFRPGQGRTRQPPPLNECGAEAEENVSSYTKIWETESSAIRTVQ